MLLIGLTGQSGAGKSYVTTLCAHYNIPSIDCDLISKEVCAPNTPCTRELIRCFGNGILDESGSLNRKKLAQIVFSDNNSLARLNQITHPYILDALDQKISSYQRNGYKALILDAPTLIESGLYQRCDVIVAVVASMSLRLKRIQRRDALTKEQAQQRLTAQPQEDFYRQYANYVIENNAENDCHSQVVEILGSLDLLNK